MQTEGLLAKPIHCFSNVERSSPASGRTPGKNSILIMMDDNDEYMYYTKGRRSKELKTKKYMMKRQKEQNKLLLEEDIKTNKEGIKLTTIKDLETELSKYTSKSYITDKYSEYISKKNEYLNILLKFYSNKLFRILNWYGHINKQKSETKLFNDIIKKYGKNVTLIIGDH